MSEATVVAHWNRWRYRVVTVTHGETEGETNAEVHERYTLEQVIMLVGDALRAGGTVVEISRHKR